MAGIDSIINTRADAFTNNPQGLMQRYAMSQDLLDLLALQKLKQDKEAAQRSLQMQMQAPQNTVKDQLEGQVMDMTKQEVAQSMGPGIQQQGQRMQAEQLQQAMSAGLGGLQAPAGLGMAQGGIVGYAGPEGSSVKATTPFERWWAKARAAADERTGDPIADAILESRRAAEAMSPEEQARLNAISDRYKAIQGRTGLMGLFYPQSDEERQAAIQEREALLNTPAISATPAPTANQESELPRRTLPPNRTYARAHIDETPAAPEKVAAAAPAAAPAQDPRISRWEEQLAELEAEKGSKTSALIDFLLAAGASGGTNLGATLTGGGSGLRARDARLAAQEADIIKNIETLNLENARLAQQQAQFEQGQTFESEQNALERTNRLEIIDRQVNEAVARAQAAAGADITQAQMQAFIEARKALADDPILKSRFMNIERTYKNNPVEMEVQKQIAVDEFMDDYLAPFGLSPESSFGVTQFAQ